MSSAEAIIREIVRLGDPYGVEVQRRGAQRRTPQEAILRQLKLGGHNLLVIGRQPAARRPAVLRPGAGGTARTRRMLGAVRRRRSAGRGA